jgi:hypothetical protein
VSRDLSDAVPDMSAIAPFGTIARAGLRLVRAHGEANAGADAKSGRGRARRRTRWVLLLPSGFHPSNGEFRDYRENESRPEADLVLWIAEREHRWGGGTT